MTINDLTPEEQEAYERITDMLSQEYDETLSWYRIGALLEDVSDY